MDIVQFLPLIISSVSLFVSLLTFLKGRKFPSTLSKLSDSHPIDVALNELHSRSRNAGGKVHIHDVEETLRRRLR